jgi:ubiquinone/menaquinone biosynthesis C-methylase UbiE
VDNMIPGTHTRFDFGTLAQGYERWYQTTDGKVHDSQQQAAVRRVLPFPGPNARLLDVGSGTGHWSRFYASLGFNVIGVDLSRPMIQQACSHERGHCLFGIADAYNLPFGDGVFDVVSAMAVVEFVPSPEAIIAEMFRCVRKDGAVVVGALNRLAPLNRARVEDGKEPYSSARLFSPTELRNLLGLYGAVNMRMADPGIEYRENGQNGALIVARASRSERTSALFRE